MGRYKKDMDNLNLRGDFNNFLNGLDEQNYYILEEEIDIEIQNSYFKLSRKEAKSANKQDVMAKAPLLTSDEVAVEDKKIILSQLASLSDVEAFRVLEKNQGQFQDEELNTWSVLAYNEARMILNGSLKNEQQVFISTGLGGKKGKFRYFLVLLPSEEQKEFTAFDTDFIKKELDFTLKRHGGELEKVIEEEADYLSYKILIPFKSNVPKLFKEVLENCNQLSPFVSDQFIITNVSEMNREEILNFIDEVDWDDNEIVEDIVSLN